jgi:hypothetical protein
LLWLFGNRMLRHYLPGLALNHNPLYFSLPSS